MKAKLLASPRIDPQVNNACVGDEKMKETRCGLCFLITIRKADKAGVGASGSETLANGLTFASKSCPNAAALPTSGCQYCLKISSPWRIRLVRCKGSGQTRSGCAAAQLAWECSLSSELGVRLKSAACASELGVRPRVQPVCELGVRHGLPNKRQHCRHRSGRRHAPARHGEDTSPSPGRLGIITHALRRRRAGPDAHPQ